MTDTLRNKCELFERNRTAITKKFMFEKELMSIAAALIFTGADREADTDKLKECRRILNKHTGFFSEYRDAVKLALISRMALSDDPEQYIEDVKAVYKKLHEGHFKDNSYMVLAAMLLCDLGRQSAADEVVMKHNELMQRMEKLHPILTDNADISYVILLALSDRPADTIIEDMEACLEYLKKTRKIKAGSDSVQGLGEILALTDGDITEKCDKVIGIYNALKDSKAELGSGAVFSSLALLIGIDEAPEVIAREIMETYEFLDGRKLFDIKSGDKTQRLLFAELLAASSHGACSAMISNAFINSAIGILKAQQIAAVISVISNVLPTVLSAVSGSGEEAAGGEAAQAEQQTAESDITS